MRYRDFLHTVYYQMSEDPCGALITVGFWLLIIPLYIIALCASWALFLSFLSKVFFS